MKKKLLKLMLSTGLFTCSILPAEAQVAAVANWILSADQTSTSVGDVLSTNQVISGLEIKNYQSITSTAGYNNGVAVTGQRVLPTAASGWPANEASEVSNRYTEYTISPVAGKDLKVQSVSIDFGDAGSTLLMKAHVYYSIDNFANRVRLSDEAGLTLPKLDADQKWRQDVFGGLAVIVPSGGNFKIRVYPWWPSSTSTSKYLVQSNVKISGVTGNPGTLPLNFLSFTAKPDALGKSVNLNWQTTNEINTKEFIIEKRTGTSEFTAIDTKPSHNTAGVHNYSYTDNNVSSGVAYYRLKQVDNDGLYDYSTVASADIKGSLSFSVYPNPTTDRLNVVHESALASSTVKILNLSGKTLIENAVNTGSTTTDVNVSSLSSGSYVLLFDGINQQNALKFIKK